jgi:hypothetical protein
MKPSITVEVAPTGDVQIEGHGFKGPECEQATRFLEEALGIVRTKAKKPEHNQTATTKLKQTTGG